MADEPSSPESPWPVALLGEKLRGYIDRLGTAWVEGEITQWNISAGNVYGRLKDVEAEATIAFTIWSSVRRHIPEDLVRGARVIARVKPNYWVKGGTLTMQVQEMRHVGLGDLIERIERLRRQLTQEGLFDAARKKPLPFLPHLIGLVTGRDSDAEKDVKRNSLLRWPAVAFRTAYAAVQGDHSVAEVVAAIELLDADPDVDVIIVARGGGDFQNLLSFSDERVVRAAAACRTPIVSAIGHEADRPLLDEVADLRASTPTDAAKRVVPDVAEEIAAVQQARSRIRLHLTGLVRREAEALERIRTRPVLAGSAWIVDSRAEELGRYRERLDDLLGLAVERGSAETARLRAQVRALSPRRTLERGYAIVQDEQGAVLHEADGAPAGTSLTITLASGRLRARSEGAEEH